VGEDVEAKGAFRFYTRNVGAETVMDKIEDAIEKSLIGFRLGKQNVSLTSEQLQKIIRRARLDSFKVDPEGKTSRRDFGGVYVASIVFAMILLMTIITFGVTALRGILEEKSSRIIEVLLSSMTPFELLAGKVVGVCLVGLTQILAYVVTGAALALYTSGSTGFANDVMSAFTPSVVGFFLVYYLLGVFLFLSMFVAVGSMVNTEQEAQHFQQPIIWALVIPIYATFFFINNPDSLIARLASFIPFFTPMVMLMRISVLTPPWWEIGLSIAIMAVTTVGVVWVVSRIFRVGILMYGKRPNVPEIVRWVRTG
jgi:ABC-2 type transport system permease protein